MRSTLPEQRTPRGAARSAHVRAAARPPLELIVGFAVAALLTALYLYSPALEGPFLFDDHGLPYASRAMVERPLSDWISIVRPVLMTSYWLTGRLFGPEPAAYHFVNVVLHAANSVLVLLFILRLLRLRDIPNSRAFTLAAAAAAIFLVHPVQTESVAYIAGRSESLGALFALSALVIFIHQPRATMSAKAAAFILTLYGCAVLSKEHTVVLPALFVLTDVLALGRTPREAIRERRSLYLGLAVIALTGLVVVAAVLMSSTTAGFRLEGLSPWQYFLTQSRVAFLYLQLILLPLWQNADYDFPISRTLDVGTAVALLILTAFLFLLWRIRHRYPLAVYGIALGLIWLAPTSTFIPIQDVAAERRLYLPLFGFTLVLVEIFLRQNRVSALALAVPCLIAGTLTWQRAAVWADEVAFWSDTVSKAESKTRGYAHLMHSLIRKRECEIALQTASGFPARASEDSDFLVSLGYAYDCLRRPEDATQAYERAAARAPGPGLYLVLANAYDRLGRTTDAHRVRSQALELEPKTGFDRMTLERYQLQADQTRARTPAP